MKDETLKAAQVSRAIWNNYRRAEVECFLSNRSMPPCLTSLPGVISALVNPSGHAALDYYSTEQGDLQLKWQALIAEQLAKELFGKSWRLENISPYKPWKKIRRSKRLMEDVQLEAKLWSATLRLVERLHTKVPNMPHPAAVLWLLIHEHSLIFFNASIDGDYSQSRQLVAARQRENKQLQEIEQPFDPSQAPIAFEVIRCAQYLVESWCDSFEQEFYRPLIEARSAVTTNLRQGRHVLFKNGKLSTQGRRNKI